MANKIGRKGQEELARIDSTIYFTKKFVESWRTSPASEKLQFIDFLTQKASCPERFMAFYKPLDHLHRSFGSEFVSRAFMLADTYRTKTIDDLVAV